MKRQKVQSGRLPASIASQRKSNANRLKIPDLVKLARKQIEQDETELALETLYGIYNTKPYNPLDMEGRAWLWKAIEAVENGYDEEAVCYLRLIDLTERGMLERAT